MADPVGKQPRPALPFARLEAAWSDFIADMQMRAQMRGEEELDISQGRLDAMQSAVNELLASRYDNTSPTLRSALERLSRYPMERGDEMSAATMRQVAREALEAHPSSPGILKESPEVAEKSARNEWDGISDFIDVWNEQQRGKWSWPMNTRCKYVELRIDMRDGGCIIRDRHGVRISAAQLAYQLPEGNGNG